MKIYVVTTASYMHGDDMNVGVHVFRTLAAAKQYLKDSYKEDGGDPDEPFWDEDSFAADHMSYLMRGDDMIAVGDIHEKEVQ